MATHEPAPNSLWWLTSPSTASGHLNRLKTERLVKVLIQGKHRYYSLEGPNVASALEGLSVLAGGSRDKFAPNMPSRLRAARTCYDHMAGTLGVALHDRFQALGWLSAGSPGSGVPPNPEWREGVCGAGHRPGCNPDAAPPVCIRLPGLE